MCRPRRTRRGPAPPARRKRCGGCGPAGQGGEKEREGTVGGGLEKKKKRGKKRKKEGGKIKSNPQNKNKKIQRATGSERWGREGGIRSPSFCRCFTPSCLGHSRCRPSPLHARRAGPRSAPPPRPGRPPPRRRRRRSNLGSARKQGRGLRAPTADAASRPAPSSSCHVPPPIAKSRGRKKNKA